MAPADAERRPELRIAWLGHSAGRRADGLTSYSEQVVGGLRNRGAAVYFHHSAADGMEVPGDPTEVIAWPTLRFKTVTLPQPGFRRGMSRWLANRHPDITHCSVSFTLDDGWVGRAAVAAGSATVATFHLPFGRPGSGRALVMRELHRFWARRLGGYQRVIVFAPEHLERLAEVGFQRERLVVVPNAVDVDVFSPGEGRLRQTRLSGAELVVGYAGRLDPEKGVRELLEGFQRAGLGANVRLLLAGRGSLERTVARAAARDSRIVPLGQLLGVERRVDFWRSVDVFCLPSSAEGLSIAMLEAMAAGCAIAVTPAGGLPALAGAGLELDPRRLAESVAGWLRELGSNPDLAAVHGTMARAEAVRHHGLQPMLNRLLAIYAEVMPHSSWSGERAGL